MGAPSTGGCPFVFSTIFYFAFVYYFCEKYYKSITVQYYIANYVSCVSTLTWLDLQTNWT